MDSDPEYDLTRQYKWGRMLERGEADRSPLDPDSINHLLAQPVGATRLRNTDLYQ